MAFEFLKRLLSGAPGGAQAVTTQEITAEECFDLSAELYVRELAFWSCVNTVANAVSKCEFKTFQRKKEVKGDEYYLWNLSPNQNQNSSTFIHKWIAQLYQYNEALIIEEQGRLLVADSFSRKPYALYGDVFTQVMVGDYKFIRSFEQHEVLYFRRSDQNMRRITNGLYTIYQKLIDYGMKSYRKSRGSKGVVTLDTMMLGNADFQTAFTDLRNQDFRAFAEAENAVLPLWKGMNYTDLGGKTYTNEGTRDIKAMMDDVAAFTAKAFGIPPALLSGDVEGTKEAMDHFLTFCIDPLCDMLQEELNRKRYGRAEYLAGDRIQIDTRCIQHVDLLSVSSAIDKLIGSGAFCINDIRGLVGETPIDEPWANQHFMTKNYATVADLLAALNGGSQ